MKPTVAEQEMLDIVLHEVRYAVAHKSVLTFNIDPWIGVAGINVFFHHDTTGFSQQIEGVIRRVPKKRRRS